MVDSEHVGNIKFELLIQCCSEFNTVYPQKRLKKDLRRQIKLSVQPHVHRVKCQVAPRNVDK